MAEYHYSPQRALGRDVLTLAVRFTPDRRSGLLIIAEPVLRVAGVYAVVY